MEKSKNELKIANDLEENNNTIYVDKEWCENNNRKDLYEKALKALSKDIEAKAFLI